MKNGRITSRTDFANQLARRGFTAVGVDHWLRPTPDDHIIQVTDASVFAAGRPYAAGVDGPNGTKVKAAEFAKPEELLAWVDAELPTDMTVVVDGTVHEVKVPADDPLLELLCEYRYRRCTKAMDNRWGEFDAKVCRVLLERAGGTRPRAVVVRENVGGDVVGLLVGRDMTDEWKLAALAAHAHDEAGMSLRTFRADHYRSPADLEAWLRELLDVPDDAVWDEAGGRLILPDYEAAELVTDQLADGPYTPDPRIGLGPVTHQRVMDVLRAGEINGTVRRDGDAWVSVDATTTTTPPTTPHP